METVTIIVPPEPRDTAQLLSNTNCPVARALRKQFPDSKISVSGSLIKLDGQWYVIAGMPRWLDNAFRSTEMTPEFNFTLGDENKWPK